MAEVTAVVWPDVSVLAARLGAEETMRAIGQELERVALFVREAEAWEITDRVVDTAQATVRSVGGGHSEAFWRGVAQCEHGGTNGARYGYLSIMDPRAGSLSWDEQVAWANRIISDYGDGAWAQACVNAGYAASPSG